jgi:hypothetical protein
MKDKELQIEEIESSHTLGGVGHGHVTHIQVSGDGVHPTS